MAKGDESSVSAGGITFTQAELETLIAGFKQLGHGNVDHKQLAADIGGDLKPGAISKRWSRLREKILGKGFLAAKATESTPDGGSAKKRRAAPASGGKGRKKAKVEPTVDEEAEGEAEVDGEKDVDENVDEA